MITQLKCNMLFRNRKLTCLQRGVDKEAEKQEEVSVPPKVHERQPTTLSWLDSQDMVVTELVSHPDKSPSNKSAL